MSAMTEDMDVKLAWGPAEPHNQFAPDFRPDLNIMQRLWGAAGEVREVRKEQGPTFKVVTHDSVTRACKDSLRRWGVWYYADIDGDPIVDIKFTEREKGEPVCVLYDVRCRVKVVFKGIHGGDCIIVYHWGQADERLSKGPRDKAIGKCVSYAVKYALLKTLGLETGDDPDEATTLEQVMKVLRVTDEQVKSVNPDKLMEGIDIMALFFAGVGDWSMLHFGATPVVTHIQNAFSKYRRRCEDMIAALHPHPRDQWRALIGRVNPFLVTDDKWQEWIDSITPTLAEKVKTKGGKKSEKAGE